MLREVRVHELAKECGVTSREVLDALKKQGEFVKSASSRLNVRQQRLAREGVGTRDTAGGAPEHDPPDPTPSTSWEQRGVDAAVEAIWRRAGLGDHDADLAQYLLENGVLPEDLKIKIRGRSAVSRLRGGQESRSLLVQEILEARSSVPQQPRPLPSKEIRRRYATE